MKIATWNVNSLSVRLPQLLNWLQQQQPDIVAVQETKTPDDKFPVLEIQSAGYQVLFSGQKTYNGVALLSRLPGTSVITDLPGFTDLQRRVLGATYGQLRVLNLYVPNGQAVGSDKYEYKLNWLKYLTNYVKDSLSQNPYLIVLGDFNIAPTDADIHDPLKWAGQILVSPLERAALQELLSLGLHDTFRLFNSTTDCFSWWDYRAGAFRRNHGARIDLILASSALSANCQECRIDKEPRCLERPSDHAPVVAIFEIDNLF